MSIKNQKEQLLTEKAAWSENSGITNNDQQQLNADWQKPQQTHLLYCELQRYLTVQRK